MELNYKVTVVNKSVSGENTVTTVVFQGEGFNSTLQISDILNSKQEYQLEDKFKVTLNKVK